MSESAQGPPRLAVTTPPTISPNGPAAEAYFATPDATPKRAIERDSPTTAQYVDSLSEHEAKHQLKMLLRKQESMDEGFRQVNLQLAHFKFNYQMLLAEQEDRAKRAEVEFHLVNSTNEILCNKLVRSTDEEHTFRVRHLKAKKRVAELTEDFRRQQHSIDHLQRALSSKTQAHAGEHRPSANEHYGDGGLDVLSDAAGQLVQLRELEQSSQESPDAQSSRTPGGLLLSPLPFSAGADGRTKKRSLSQSSMEEAQQLEGKPGRRTFNSSGNLDSRYDGRVPITPVSPKRRKSESRDAS